MAENHHPGQIVVLGSVNMDLITTADRLPNAGETLLGSSFDTAPGGKGGNQAIAAASAGGDVEFIGAVGDDAFGHQLRGALTDHGVSVRGLRTVPGPSGIAAISVDARGENSIIVVAGANGSLTRLTDTDRETVQNAALLVCQLEIPLACVVSAVGIASAAGVPVLLNPSPARELPADLLSGVTVLVVNEGEAALLGPTALGAVPHLVTTHGGAGADYRGPDEEFRVVAPKVTAVDTTGAGDAFTGALAVAWIRHTTPRSAVQLACAAGALAATKPGAGASAPTEAQIGELVTATYRL